MKKNGVRPGSRIVYTLVMGSIINGRKDLAEAYAEEFRANGIQYVAWLACLPISQTAGCLQLDLPVRLTFLSC